MPGGMMHRTGIRLIQVSAVVGRRVECVCRVKHVQMVLVWLVTVSAVVWLRKDGGILVTYSDIET